MSAPPDEQALTQLLRDSAAMLRFQGELGCDGVDLASGWLRETSKAAVPALKMPTLKTPPAGSAPQQVRGAAGLKIISDELGDCQRCKLSKGRTSIVFGVGHPQARLMFVGEGPGLDEDLQGEPFVGAAGKLLDRMIGAMGLKRSDVYIANVVKCRPPRNRDPEPDEVETCLPYLQAQIRAVAPEVIVALGRQAVMALLGDSSGIRKLRGQWRSYEGIAVMPTYHPAYLLRSPEEKRPAWEDLQAVMGRLGLPLAKP
jgi:uracil-DNA glycosylase